MLQRISEPVRNLHVFAPEFAHQLDVVIARNAKRRTGLNHAHYQAEYVWNLRATVHKIAKKDHLASFWGLHGIAKSTLTVGLLLDGIAKLS